MEQKQKIKKRAANKNGQEANTAEIESFKDSPSKQVQGAPALQKTFSLGEAT